MKKELKNIVLELKYRDASSAILKAGAFGAKTFNDELEYLYIGEDLVH